jgi:hypothetical protein
MRRGYDWRRALPKGYALSLAGAAVFLTAGAFDFWWHTAFGFEVNVETLLSPAHLALAAGGVMLVTGPLRAAWYRPDADAPAGWKGLLPALLSLLLLLSLFSFFTQYVHFTTDPAEFTGPRPEATYYRDLLGVTSALLYATAMMGVTLFALRRWKLPAGSMTLLIGGNSILMFLMRFKANEKFGWLLAAVLAASIVADILLGALKPGPDRVTAFRAFAFLVPTLVFLFYYVTLVNTVGTWWRIHMWLGVPLQAGAVGLALSYLVLPLKAPGPNPESP